MYWKALCSRVKPVFATATSKRGWLSGRLPLVKWHRKLSAKKTNCNKKQQYKGGPKANSEGRSAFEPADIPNAEVHRWVAALLNCCCRRHCFRLQKWLCGWVDMWVSQGMNEWVVACLRERVCAWFSLLILDEKPVMPAADIAFCNGKHFDRMKMARATMKNCSAVTSVWHCLHPHRIFRKHFSGFSAGWQLFSPCPLLLFSPRLPATRRHELRENGDVSNNGERN